MATLLTIGEFSRATHLSIKALRHYDEVGLLAPAEVDPSSGYRLYVVAQVPVAQVIRRFRDLDMPLETIGAVLTAPDRDTRDRLIVDHLQRMEAKLDQTQATVASLRALLEGGGEDPVVEIRDIPPSTAIAANDVVAWDDAEVWLGEAIERLHAALAASGVEPSGPTGALYSERFFEAHHGEVVAFIPAGASAGSFDLPGGRYAVMVHRGPFSTLDVTYGALGSYVAERAIQATGAIRENYVVDAAEDPADLRTEVAWPITGDA